MDRCVTRKRDAWPCKRSRVNVLGALDRGKLQLVSWSRAQQQLRRISITCSTVLGWSFVVIRRPGGGYVSPVGRSVARTRNDTLASRGKPGTTSDAGLDGSPRVCGPPVRPSAPPVPSSVVGYDLAYRYAHVFTSLLPTNVCASAFITGVANTTDTVQDSRWDNWSRIVFNFHSRTILWDAIGRVSEGHTPKEFCSFILLGRSQEVNTYPDV